MCTNAHKEYPAYGKNCSALLYPSFKPGTILSALIYLMFITTLWGSVSFYSHWME